MNPLAVNIEVQEMPPDGSKCVSCKNVIEGIMFQYFLFEGFEPTPTKLIVCEKCYGKKS